MQTFTLVYPTGYTIRRDFVSLQAAMDYADWESVTLRTYVYVLEAE